MNEKFFYKKSRIQIFFVLMFLSVTFLFFKPTVTGQTRRALLIGINKYEPAQPVKMPLCRKEWSDLYGNINDVEAMKGILVSRFGFLPKNIHVLANRAAAKRHILSGIEKYLIKDASPGDICIFYYSGHGSRVRNSKSTEPDKKDETLVPADWYRVNQDIRDKELKKLYNRVLDKGARLAVIVDSCHSGSISRGIPVRLRCKALPENTCDVADAADEKKEPAERGALILSAAQDFQGAVEREYNNNMYGAFTWALLKVLRSVPTYEPAQNVLLKVRAMMQSDGISQEPNLEGLPELVKGPLFGPGPLKEAGIMAAVIKVNSNCITFQGGIAAGIRKNCELQKIAGNSRKSKVRIRVTMECGLNRCRAEVIHGDARDIQVGDLFEIRRWAAPPEARMKVWIPAGNLSQKNLLNMCRGIESLRNSSHIEWVDDPTEVTPTHIMSWEGCHWCLKTRDGKTIKLGKRPAAETILKTIRSDHRAASEKPRFFLHLPLSSEIQKIMAPEIEYYSDSIERLSSGQDVHYVLVGRFTGDKITYAWVLPNMMRKKEKGFAMPIRTRWIAVGRDELTKLRAVNNLRKMLLRLVKIRAWLQLSSPPDRGDFPYRLALKNANTGEIKTRGPLVEGDCYGLVLRADKEKPAKKVEKRYVYVFSIDSEGKGTRLFPPDYRRSSENYFPVDEKFQSEIKLGEKKIFNIAKPFGVDTYFLLTAEEPITQPGVLDFSGVRREPPVGVRYTPLERLLYGLGSGHRGKPPVTHINWSVQRLPISSRPKDK